MAKEGRSFVKPGFLAQKRMTPYEKLRKQTIAENAMKVDALNLKILANPFNGLKENVGSRSARKGNKKMGNSGDDDEEYLPPEGEECPISSSEDEESYASRAKKANHMGFTKKAGGHSASNLTDSQRSLGKSSTPKEATSILPPVWSMIQTDPADSIPAVATGQPTVIPTSSAQEVDQSPTVPTVTSCVRGSSSSRRRGPTLGKRSAKIIAHNEGKKLVVPVPEEMRAFCGKNAQMASNELGLQIRRMCPIQGFKVSWKSIDPAIKESISQAVQDKFDIVDAFENRALAKEVTNEKAYLLYKNWKCKMRLYYVKLVEDGYDAYSHPYTGVTLDDWKYLIDHVFHDPDLEERRIAGKANRSKLGPGHTMGSRSIPAEMTIHAEENNGDLPDFCNLYEKAHTLKKTKQWIDPKCRERHAEMKRVRDEAKQNGTPLTHEEISRTVLGEKKRYIRGFGVGPKPTCSSSTSVYESQVHQEELQRLTTQVDSLQKERQIEREERQREREELQSTREELQRECEEHQREREEQQRERDEARAHREAQEERVDLLQSTLKKLLDSNGGLNFLMGDHRRTK